MNEIANQNINRLASLSTAFCATNNITPNGELVKTLTQAVMAAIGRWYAENGQPNFSPLTDLICDEAYKYAFGRMQVIATLASISVMAGVTMDELAD